MIIFATSDTHNNNVILKKLKKFLQENKFDYIIHCGDIGGKAINCHTLMEFSIYQYEHYLYFKQEFPQVLYILGNDDWFEANPLDNKYLLSNACVPDFIGFEWVNITPFNTNREANENKIWYELNKLDICHDSIIISHAPPYRCQDKTDFGKSVGSKSIKKFITNKQPKLWLCGHIHESFCVDKVGNTTVFNCSCEPGKDLLRGWIIDTDTLDYKKVIL